MREQDPQPDPVAAGRIAGLLGPGLLLILLVAWGLIWIGPERDRQRLLDQREAGLAELPPAPPPGATSGIDNRTLDPREERGSPPPPAHEQPPGPPRHPGSIHSRGRKPASPPTPGTP